MNIKCFVPLLAIFSTCSAFASAVPQPDLTLEGPELGEPTYEGSGCPEGSLIILLGSNKKSVSFQFNPISLESGGSAEHANGKKECNITFPLHVGMRNAVAVPPVKLSGRVTLPSGAVSQLGVHYYYEYSYGTSRMSFLNKWFGQQYSAYSIYAPRNSTSPFWSNCGSDMNLRINITMETQNNDHELPAVFTLEQIEGFELLTAHCR
jgi:hypothetical protein